MKYVTVFCTLILLLVCSCRGPTKTPQNHWYSDSGKVKVLSTTAMIEDLVRGVGGDRVDSIPLIRGETDPHSYELVKGDDEKIAVAQLLVGNGLNLEHGASLQAQLSCHQNTLLLADVICQRASERILTFGHEVDPHIWMDISLWAEGVEPIVAALSALQPEDSGYFEKRGKDLKERMLCVHEELKEMLLQVPNEKRFLVTSHDAFHYFTRAYLSTDDAWEKRCMAPEGLAPEGQLSTRDIQRVIDHLCTYQIGVVFPESNVSRAALEKIVASCKSKGLFLRICPTPLYGDAMGAPGSGADTYLGMMRKNAEVLKREWK